MLQGSNMLQSSALAGAHTKLCVAALLLVAALAGARPAFAAGPVQDAAPQPAPPPASSEQRNCSTCHADEVKQLAANPHSRGAQQVSCTDCHQPHGANPSVISRKAAHSIAEQNATCTKCHSALAGPFSYEHPPVKVEGCVSCHAAHGAQDANFLAAGDVPKTCRQCHEVGKTSLHAHDISAEGLVRNRAGQYVPCTNCHSHIHGSNDSKFFFVPKEQHAASAPPA